MRRTLVASVLVRRSRWLAAIATAVCLVVTLPVAQSAAATPANPGSASAPQLVPKPVSVSTGSGSYLLTPWTRIIVAAQSAAALPVAQDLAGYLRPATGYPLPVVTGNPGHGDIELVLGTAGTLAADTTGEGYQLDTTTHGVVLEASTPHGLYNGVQTLRQLLPPWIASPTARPGPWTIPVTRITDFPRYTYRGLMLDIGRHYESPAAVQQLVDQAAAYKINVLHLHLSDDQGFRIAINGFPNLSTIGGQGSAGTGGRTMDPGGYWTQADYKAVVAYAAAHFMTVIPEVDTPGHNNAIIMAEYNDTTNPLLNGHPQDINCGKNNPPVWNYTTDVGYSALCPTSQNAWTILTAIISQLSAISPSPYYSLGGDEVPSTVLNQAQYAALINKEAGIVQSQDKIVMGWADIAGPGSNLAGPSVAEYWQPASGSSPGTATATEAVQRGMKLVMAPANHTYVDQKYVYGSAGNVPPTLGLHWACPSGCDVDQFYNWDPSSLVTGVTDSNVMGVEGSVWSETLVNVSNVDYMMFPRLLAVAEIGWSPKADRTSTSSPAYTDFLTRLAGQGARLLAAGTNFFPSTEVPWRLDLSPAVVSTTGQVSGTVATLAAPGFAPSAVTAAINWGDGTSTSGGSVAGTASTDSTVNGLYTVGGQHSYAHAGGYFATVTVSAPGTTPTTAHFVVFVR